MCAVQTGWLGKTLKLLSFGKLPSIGKALGSLPAGITMGYIMLQVCGWNKTTLLDYPGRVAATVFLGGCNFRCPFCQNGDLVLRPGSQPVISRSEVMGFLKKRRGILAGVCITGGEPTLSEGLADFIKEIKEIGYMVKLDTNGYKPETLGKLAEGGLLDYIAMDIKNSMERYGETVGVAHVDTGRVRESIHIIMESGIEYEFRTTIVKELHGEAEVDAVGREIKGAKNYFLQSYQESAGVIASGFHAYGKESLERLAECARHHVEKVSIRGVE